MTRNEVGEAIHRVIQFAVQKSGGDWKRSYQRDVEEIFTLMGKLTPEPKPKPELPPLDKKLLARAKRIKERAEFTDEQRAAARRIIAELGLE